MSGPRLHVDGLRVVTRPGGVEVVDEVAFEVAAGQVLGLAGESGSGKTTVALALLGYTRRGLRIESGEVMLDGRDLLGLPEAQLRSLRGAAVAYVPQDPGSALNPTAKVGAQVKEALAVHGMTLGARERVSELLDDVQLEPALLERYPHQLSGGQQQRVAIAMAFACRPALIVLDEPTTGLDVSTQRRILETVRTLCTAHDVAAICVSHDLATMSELADQVAVMYAGRIIELGSTERVFATPAHPYTRRLITAIPEIERAQQLEGIAGQPPRPGERPRGCFFAPRCEMQVPKCLAALPPLDPVGGRLVRCIRADESLARSRAARVGVATAVAPDPPVPALAVSAVSAAYGETEVLHDVSLSVAQGECSAVVGESGSGKTTLARCILGLHTDWSGQIELEGGGLPAGVRQRPRQAKRSLQYVFQNPYASLNPRRTIGQAVMQPLLDFGVSQADRSRRVLLALEGVSLSSRFAEHYPDQLSGGERQRVAIARALVLEPKILVCDEITSALDVSVQAVIVELLRGLQRDRGLSLLFITHNLALARSIAQSMVVLARGRVVEHGRVADVLDHPQDEYTVSLMRDVPRLAAGAAGTASASANSR